MLKPVFRLQPDLLRSTFFFLAGGLLAAHNANSPDGVAMTVLVGAFHLPLIGYAAILGVCVALAAMAGLFSRLVAAAHLRVLS